MNVELRPRTLGENLGLTFQLAVTHFWKLVVIQAIASLPVLVMQLVMVGDPEDMEQLMIQLVALLATLSITAVVGPVATGALVMIVSQSFTGRRVGVGEAIMMALRRVFSLLGFGLLVGLVVALGLVLLVVPGLMFMTWFYVGSCAVMIDRCSATDALTRSKTLSDGYRWPIFWYIVILGLISGAGPQVLSAFAGIFMADAGEMFTESLTWGFSVLLGVIASVGPVAIYFDLCVRKESFDVERLADLVDVIGSAEGGAGAEGRH